MIVDTKRNGPEDIDEVQSQEALERAQDQKLSPAALSPEGIQDVPRPSTCARGAYPGLREAILKELK